MGNIISSDKTNKDNEQFVGSITQLFTSSDPKNQPHDSDMLTTLNLDQFSGGCITPPKNRYAEFEQQLGGSLKTAEQFNNITKFFSHVGGKDPNDDSDLMESDDDLSDLDMDDIEQDGGNLSVTSTSNMAEVNAVDVSKLSATSMPNNNVQAGGCDHLTSELFGHIEVGQSGGNAKLVDSQTSLSSLSMFGGKKSSESINVMPLFSSTSGTEYYNDMQRENRYT